MKLLYSGLILFLFLGLTACNNDDDNGDGGNIPPPVEELSIYETAVASADLTILVEALERTGLDATLNEAGTYTVFAPTNDAFTNAGISLDDFSDEELTDLLLNHVLGAVVLSTELTTGYQNTLATGPESDGTYPISLFVNTEGGVTLNGVSSPVEGGLDIAATNGVIHLIDTPLAIPNVVDHVVANPDFQALEEAVLSFEAELTDILTGAGPFTIFAPTNEAFENLASTLGVAEVDEETLRTILLYHVVVGANVQSGDLVDGEEIVTANGESLFPNLGEGPRIIDGTGGGGVNITATDIQGSNGVIHQVDRVLLPPSVVNPNVEAATIYQLAKLTPGYATLATAIEMSGLQETLSDPDANFTVFAPNDDAFIAYLETLDLASIEDLEAEQVANILLNHVIDGQFAAADLVGAGTQYTTTLATVPNDDEDNISLYIEITEGPGVSLNGVSNVIFPDTQASNGIVHLVDAVIPLPTVVTFATADPSFSNLVEALSAVEDSAGYIALLETPWGTDPAPFTVFAPNDEAFADVLTELGVESLGDIPADTVEAALALHVITGANVRSDDVTDGPVTTAGGEVTLGTTGGVTITDANGRVSTVIAADVQAANGVIHVIDTVILPDLTP